MTTQKWPADTFAEFGSTDFGSAYHERGEIDDLVRDAKITGFAIVSGDRHSFWAVRSCLEYARSFDVERARAVSNPQLSPHVEFVDLGGHGYATVRLTGNEMRTEFVCIPRPITRSDRPDGGPLRYRVVHTASLWKPGERPVLRQQVVEGDPGLSI
jgi:hypothetical protein